MHYRYVRKEKHTFPFIQRNNHGLSVTKKKQKKQATLSPRYCTNNFLWIAVYVPIVNHLNGLSAFALMCSEGKHGLLSLDKGFIWPRKEHFE